MKTNKSKIKVKGILLVGLFSASLHSLHAQMTPETMPQRGLVPAGSYAISDLETINAVNGNVFYRIPLTSLPPGKAGWNMGLNLTYNSQIYDLNLLWGSSHDGTQTVFQQLQASQWGGWRYGYMYSMNRDIRPQISGGGSCNVETTYKVFRMSVISPDGSHHTLHLYPNTPNNTPNYPGYTYLDYNGDGYYEVNPDGATAACSNSTPAGDLTYYTSDGSYLKVVFSHTGGSSYWTNHQWTIYFPDGRTATGYGAQMLTMSDRNGNTITVQNTTNQTLPDPITQTALTDDNRSITIRYNPGSTTSTQDTITQTGYPEPGVSQTLTWTVNWTNFSLSGTSFKYGCTSQGDDCTAGSGGTPALGLRVVSSIVLPTSTLQNPQTYSFGYNTDTGWGELNLAKFPSGAQVNYHYSQEGQHQYKENFFLTEDPVSQKTLTWTDEDDPVMPTRTETSNYTFGNTSSQITNPDGGMVQNFFYDLFPSNSKSGLVFKVIQPDGSTSERIWQQNRPYGSQGIDSANPYVATEFKSVSSGGSPVQASVKTFAVDKNGNQTQLADYGSSTASQYGWIPYSSITHDMQGRPTGYAGGSVLRTTDNTYNVNTSPAGDGTDNNYAYWHPALPDSPTERSLLTQTTTKDSTSAVSSMSVFSYGDTSGHLNLIQEQHWDSAASALPLLPSNSVITGYEYDTFGNVTKITNPRGGGTTFTYDTTNSVCLTSKIEGATAIQNTTPWTRSFSYVCDPDTGLVTSVTFSSPAIPITSTSSYDKYGRLIKVREAGGTLTRDKTTTYSDQFRKITAKSDLATLDDLAIQQVTLYDQLGRVRMTTDPAGNSVQTRYWTPKEGDQGHGFSYQLVSNPYVSLNDLLTMGWTTTKFDPNGRVIEVQHFSGSTLPFPWGSNGPSVGTSTYSYNPAITTLSLDMTSTDTMISVASGAGIPNYALLRIGDEIVQVTAGGGTGSLTIVRGVNGTQAAPHSASAGVFDIVNNRNNTLSIDEAGVSRTNYTDGLGRLIQVTENGISVSPGVSASTTYTYDALDNLTKVTPPSPRPARTFNYSSLKRLTSAYNPETGTISYTYDSNGNVLTRNRAGVITGYQYDNLDQLAYKSYSDSTTRPVSYTYYSADRLQRVSEYGNDDYTFYDYDGFGRPGRSYQLIRAHAGIQTSWKAFNFWYAYNLADQVTSMTLPSGRIVSTTYDATPGHNTTGRVNTVSSVLGSNPSTTYFQSPTYSPHGALQKATLGNGLIEQACFNARLQPVILRQRISAGGAADCSSQANRDNFDVLHLRYDYGSTPSSANTGNIATQTSTYGSKSFVQNYTYDGGNRLLTAIETVPGAGTSWSQTYGYDVVGNRWLAYNSPGGVPQNPFTPTASTLFDSGNHMTYSGTGSPALYDGAGNQTDIGGYHYTYDAENHLLSSTITSSVNSATTMYSYNGDGRRVTKLSATGDWTFYVYDAMGNLAAEYTSSSTRMECSLCYLMADHLGSIRMLTNASGTVKSLHDYLPFGEEIPSGTGGRDTTWAHVDPTQKFTGQERDAESALDFFDTRYFSGAQARFTSADEPLNDQNESDPQSWNLYSYVRNNPLRFVDPSGQICVSPGKGQPDYDDKSIPGPTCADIAAQDKQVSPSATATAKQGNVAVAFALNAFFALDNLANSSFSFISPGSRVLSDIPTNQGGTGQVANVAVFIVTSMIGPSGKAGKLINITQSGLRHAFQRHAIGGAKTLGKSVFNAGENIPGLIKAAEAVAPVKQAGGNFARVVDAGRNIGVDRNTGAVTSIYTVISRPNGDLITAFPGRP